jgi:hypothetical protein
MIRDVRKHMTKVCLWIKSIELDRTNQAVDRGGTLSAGIGAGELVILSSQSYGPQRALGGVVVHFDLSVVTITQQRSPAR